MDSRDKLRLFASQVASVAQGLALVRDPRFDERRSRLVDGALSIDLLNMLHVVSRQTVEDVVVADLLQPCTLGAAGRVD